MYMFYTPYRCTYTCMLQLFSKSGRPCSYSFIRESVDSLCRDGSDTPIKPQHKNNNSELSDVSVLSLFRHKTCSTSVSIHGKTLKIGNILRYTGTRKFLKRQFLYLSLELQFIYADNRYLHATKTICVTWYACTSSHKCPTYMPSNNYSIAHQKQNKHSCSHNVLVKP